MARPLGRAMVAVHGIRERGRPQGGGETGEEGWDEESRGTEGRGIGVGKKGIEP